MTMKRVEALHWGFSLLEEHGLEKKAAETLLLHHTKKNRLQLLQELHEPLTKEEEERYKADVYRYLNGMPVQYLTGVEQFYGREFYVNREVLIPRQETEELVDCVLQKITEMYGSEKKLRAVDVGTGSGVIAISLKLEYPALEMMATDISNESLDVAKKNALKHGAEIQFFQGDLLSPLIEAKQKVDLIVSNPPYIKSGDIEKLSPYVRDYEPRRALDGGETGVRFYERIVSESKQVLEENGMIAFEIGDGQGEYVKQLLLSAYPQANVDIILDINKKERIVIMTKQV